MLCSYIGCRISKSYSTQYRRVIDDSTAALLLHLQQLVLHAVKHTIEVNCNHLVPAFNTHVTYRVAFSANTCIVEGNVYAAKGCSKVATVLLASCSHSSGLLTSAFTKMALPPFCF